MIILLMWEFLQTGPYKLNGNLHNVLPGSRKRLRSYVGFRTLLHDMQREGESSKKGVGDPEGMGICSHVPHPVPQLHGEPQAPKSNTEP